jgi:dipeptidyl aminopeptidase/acylaminoacyl peptidase
MRTTPSVFSKTHLAFAAWLTMGIAGSHAANAAVPGRLPALEDVSISPDGERIAYVKTHGDERVLVVTALDHPAAPTGVQVGDSKLRSVGWIDNGHLLIGVSETTVPAIKFRTTNFSSSFEWGRLLTFDVQKGDLHALSFNVPDELTYDLVAGAAAVRKVDGEPTLFVPGWVRRDIVRAALYAYSGEHHARVVATSRVGTGWLLDQSGRIAAQSHYDNDRQTWEIRTRSDNSDQMTLAASGIAAVDIPQMIGFSATGDAIIVEFVEHGAPVWKPLLLKDNSWGEPLEHGASFGRPIEGSYDGRIIGAVRGVEDPTYVFFDNEAQAHWNAVLRAFPGEHVRLASTSDDHTKMVVRVFGAKDGYVYALYDWYSHRATILGQVYDGVGAPAEVRAITYAAGDGLAIPAILTLPRGVPEKPLPLVVLPHGGPAAADTLDFNWWAQALADQGYAVLQPNYRGSTLSYAHKAAGFGEWGRKMQTDLSDGVRYLAASGVIDPQRVCIVGASYGGYAALAGVTLDTGVYRCAVSVAGLSDLKRFLRATYTMAGSSNPAQRFWDRFMGLTSPSDPALLAISPIEHVAQVSVPVLLIHGRDDTVVRYEQSQLMLNALKQAGKSVELVTLDDEDHWLSHSKTRLQMLQACVAFLKANNPPN